MFLLQNSLLLMLRVLPLSYPVSDLLFCSSSRPFVSLLYQRLLGCIISISPHAVLFIPHFSNPSTPPSPAFCSTKLPALLSTPQHLPSPLSTFSSSPSQKYLLYFQECQPWGEGKGSTHRGGCAPPSNSICIRHLSLEMAASGSPRRTFQQD